MIWHLAQLLGAAALCQFFPQGFQIDVSGSTPFPELGDEERYHCQSNDSVYTSGELVRQGASMSCSFGAGHFHGNHETGKHTYICEVSSTFKPYEMLNNINWTEGPAPGPKRDV